MHPFVGLMGIFVRGDAIVLAPFLLVYLPIVYLIADFRGVGIAWCIYMSLRSFIEVIYWLDRQSGSKQYRPPFFSKKFGNNEVYIIYQLLDTCQAVVYLTLLIILLTK